MRTKWLLPALLMISTSAFATNKEQRSLIRSNKRPLPEQILSKEEYSARDNNFNFSNAYSFETELPSLIVALEKAHPGAKYAFLGRDMDLIADAVEAFYLSIGQENRVARIRFSTPSLQGATPQLITDFLIQSGLNADPKSADAVPLVLVDYTSFSERSQSTQIIKATLSELEARGVPKNELLKRMNVFSVAYPNGAFPALANSKKDFKAFFNRQAKSIERGTQYIAGVPNFPARALAYGSEWHGTYGPISRSKDGTLATNPMSRFDVDTKQSVFHDIVQAIKISTSSQFHYDVFKLAKKHAVMIDGLEKAPEQPKKLTLIEKFQKDIADKLSDLPKLYPRIKSTNFVQLPNSNGRGYGYGFDLTANARDTVTVLGNEDHRFAPHYFQTSLDTLVALYDAERITKKDFNNIFMHLLSFQDLRGSKFLAQVRTTYQDIAPLDYVVGNEKVRTENLNIVNYLAVSNYEKLVRGGALPLSCKYLLLRK
jgi:hypothetical protein